MSNEQYAEQPANQRGHFPGPELIDNVYPKEHAQATQETDNQRGARDESSAAIQ
jgi:hypothetical protein